MNQKANSEMSKVAENYCQMFPNASATHNLLANTNGGHFCEALREGNISEMIARADMNNSMILYILSNECIYGFRPTHDDLRTLRFRAINFATQAEY